MMDNKTFEELAKDEAGTIYHEEMRGGVKFVVLRGPVSLCAYVGIPLSHPLAKQEYNDIPVECHGGLTYSGTSIDELDKNYYWYGWDYAHAGDVSFCDLESRRDWKSKCRAWTVKEVVEDSWSALRSFVSLAKLSENVYTMARRLI